MIVYTITPGFSTEYSYKEIEVFMNKVRFMNFLKRTIFKNTDYL